MATAGRSRYAKACVCRAMMRLLCGSTVSCQCRVYSQRDSKALCSWCHGGPRVRERWKRRAGARRFEPWPSSCAVCRCQLCAVEHRALDLLCWRMVRCLTHRAQGCQRRAESPSPGGGSGGALASIAARAAPQLRTAGRNEQTSCQSRRAAARPAARKQLLLPPRCRRASTSSNASARARPPGSSRPQTSRLACQPLLAARRGAFSNMKSFWRGTATFQTVCFISLYVTIGEKEQNSGLKDKVFLTLRVCGLRPGSR